MVLDQTVQQNAWTKFKSYSPYIKYILIQILSLGKKVYMYVRMY